MRKKTKELLIKVAVGVTGILGGGLLLFGKKKEETTIIKKDKDNNELFI